MLGIRRHPFSARLRWLDRAYTGALITVTPILLGAILIDTLRWAEWQTYGRDL